MAWYEEAFDETYLFTYDALLTPEHTLEQVDDLERLLELSPPADVLDMPCGQGRHSIELARRGYQVTGVDLSPYLLRVARQRAEQAGLPVVGPREGSSATEGPLPAAEPGSPDGPRPNPSGGPDPQQSGNGDEVAGQRMVGVLELVRADMRRFRRPGGFDVAINLFSSFGYLETDEEDARVLRAFYESLRPGGRLVMEMAHKYWLIQKGRDVLWVETPAGFTLERVRYDVFTDRLETERIVIVGGQVLRRRASVRQYSLVELATLARSVGFELVGAYGSLDGEEPLRVDSRRLVAVFRRP